jgi:hypothetical protein
MKTTLLVLAAAGLSGCAVYPAPAYDAYGPGPAYVVEQPVYIGGAVQYGGYPYAYPRGFYRPAPRAFAHGPPRPHLQAPRPGPGAGERHHDRDGDGVRNRSDRRPHDRNR